MDHRHINQVFAHQRQGFGILTQAPPAVEPGKGSLHNPALGQDLKTGVGQSSLDFHPHPKQALTPINQRRFVIARIQDEQRPAHDKGNPAQQVFGPPLVGKIGWMHQHAQQQPHHIHGDLSFASFDLLAPVIAARAPFSVVFTDWLSMMTTLGSAGRPACWRTPARSWSFIRSQTPARHSLRKKPYTVCQGGKSWGKARHWQPVRNTYRIAFTRSRGLWLGLRARPRLRGNQTRKCRHCSSVRSLGYAFRSFISPVYYYLFHFQNRL